jgi:cytochrome c biogenesis protein CcmG/thiol:disulfide interchange protein DsbE
VAAAAPPEAPPPPAPKGRLRSGRLLILVVLVVVAVVIPAGAALLDRRQPAPRWESRTPTTVVPTVKVYEPGTPAPPLRLEGLDGRPVDLAALRGRPVVVNFWATWCVPCVREFPLLRQAAAAHGDDRLAVVGVLTNDRPAEGRSFVRRHAATWPVGVDPTAAAAAAWGAIGLPHTWFVRPDGTLASHQLGELSQPSLDAQLARIVR